MVEPSCPLPVPDIRVLASPRTEGLKLTLWLAHPCAKEVEFSKTAKKRSRINFCTKNDLEHICLATRALASL
jgi:hypothetical protein